MKFVVNTVGKTSGRLGCFVQDETGKQYQTPLLIQTTKGGSIPYLTKEVFNYVTKEDQILHICLSTTEHMEQALEVYKQGISSFVGYENFPSFVSLKDPCEIAQSGFHEKNIIPLFTRKGKQILTAEKYMSLVEKFKPAMYHTLCDSDTNFNSPKKRIIKSVERTENFLRICMDYHKNSDILKSSFLFVPIVGGYNKEARLKCIHSIPHSEVDGYMIDGLHNYGSDALNVELDVLKDIVSHCLKEINNEKPKMMLGAYNPLMVLELIALGIDIFDTSYVYLVSFNFKALIFNFDLENKTETCKITIDLSDEKFKEDLTPVKEGCECLTCKKHTKAYVHHLMKTRELVGPILLMIHNIHHYLKYFETIHCLIVQDKLPQLIDLIKEQMAADGGSIVNSNINANLSEEKI